MKESSDLSIGREFSNRCKTGANRQAWQPSRQSRNAHIQGRKYPDQATQNSSGNCAYCHKCCYQCQSGRTQRQPFGLQQSFQLCATGDVDRRRPAIEIRKTLRIPDKIIWRDHWYCSIISSEICGSDSIDGPCGKRAGDRIGLALRQKSLLSCQFFCRSEQ